MTDSTLSTTKLCAHALIIYFGGRRTRIFKSQFTLVTSREFRSLTIRLVIISTGATKKIDYNQELVVRYSQILVSWNYSTR